MLNRSGSNTVVTYLGCDRANCNFSLNKGIGNWEWELGVGNWEWGIGNGKNILSCASCEIITNYSED
ncbi:MAG: hypothetical protein F6K47_32760 [Symploca sp. SIO2E6]|nr:hypothetical protein [Symploca sp. SIO2E6]